MNLNDRSFVKYLLLVTGILFALMVISIILANLVGGSSEEELAEIQDKNDAALLRNAGDPLRFHEPVIATAGLATASTESRSGDEVYTGNCSACHDAGVLGAPKLEAADWDDRVGKGFDTLLDHAINGFNQMPAKGGAPNLSDEEVKRAVVYMLEQSSHGDIAPEMESDSSNADSGSEASASSDAQQSAEGGLLASADMANGESVYTSKCSVCHKGGIAGAPKLESAKWEDRVAQGFDTVHDHAINGLNGMPPKGGHPDLSEQDIADAIVYMVDQAGLSFAATDASGESESNSQSSETEASNSDTSSDASNDNQAEQTAESSSAESNASATHPLLAAADPSNGESIYAGKCAVCHKSGIAGSPKLEAGKWEDRVAQGFDQVLDHAINGLNGMPPKGGHPDLSDQDIADTIVYMVREAGLDFESGASSDANESNEASDETMSSSQSSNDSAESENATTEVAKAVPPSTDADHLAMGEEVYNKGCAVCHNRGIAGAPKLGDTAKWTPRLETGYTSLQNSVLNGKNGMPARGGIPADTASDADLMAALDYMISQAQ